MEERLHQKVEGCFMVDMFYGMEIDFHTISTSLGVNSKCVVQQHRHMFTKILDSYGNQMLMQV